MSIPWTFNRNGNAKIELATRIVDFEVGNTRLDDLCLLSIRLQICRYSNFGSMSSIKPLYNRGWQTRSSFLLEFVEFVGLVWMGIVYGFPGGIAL